MVVSEAGRAHKIKYIFISISFYFYAGQTLSPKVVSGTPPYERDLKS
jgi:hypothetical protein